LIRTSSGDIIAVEVKLGRGVRNTLQAAKDLLMATEGAELVGKNAGDLTGKRLIIRTVERWYP
jgi:hypothetical protein